MPKINRRHFSALALSSLTAPPALASEYDSAACTRFADGVNWTRELSYSVNPNSQSRHLTINLRHKGYGITFVISRRDGSADHLHMSGFSKMFDTPRFGEWFERMPTAESDGFSTEVRSKAYVDLEIRDPATGWEWWVEARPIRTHSITTSGPYYASKLDASKTKTQQLLRYLSEKDRTGLEISSAGIAPDGTVTHFLSGKMSSAELRKQLNGTPQALEDLERTATAEKCAGGCFLTTACCTAFGRPDTGAELTTLRRFRDTWLAQQPEGAAIIAEYYRIAPAICAAIAADPKGHAALRRIYFGTVLPCVALIHLGLNRPAFALYHRLVTRLTARYLTRI